MIHRKDRAGFWYREKINRRVRQMALGTDFETAKARLRSLKDERQAKAAPLTVHGAAERWIERYLPLHRRERDHIKLKQRVRDYLEPSLGRVSLRDLRPKHLWEYRRVLERTHLSTQTVRHVLSDLRCLLNWCESEELISRAPVPKRLLPRIQERPPDRLSNDQVAKVVAVPDPHGFICRLLLETGLRWGEAVRAQAADIENGMLVLSQTKSGKVRRVPLSPAILSELGGRVGRFVGIANAQTVALRIQALTGIDTFHVHQLRHTFACRWLERGGSLAALQEVLGHASITTTQRYARLLEEHVRAEAAKVFGVTPRVTPSPYTTSSAVKQAVR
jgi:integrase/recombinase XerC